MVLGGGPVLVNLMDKYVGAVFLDADDDKTYVVRVVQYEGTLEGKFYEATCVRVEQGRVGRGRCHLHRLSRTARC